MPYRRFVQWIAFYKVRAEKEEQAYKDAQKKHNRRRNSKRPPPPAMSEG